MFMSFCNKYAQDIMDLGDIGKQFGEFGWHVQDIDGSDVEEIYKAINIAKGITRE